MFKAANLPGEYKMPAFKNIIKFLTDTIFAVISMCDFEIEMFSI